VAHIIYGTVVFASILFICAQDAVSVVSRYLASALVCRVIVMIEISGMREVVQMEPKDQFGFVQQVVGKAVGYGPGGTGVKT
jgi:hypothetical protein